MASIERHKHGSLPRISTSKDLSRRDSLSSSRTRDSGYNSDPDVSFSPSDCLDLDQHILPVPILSLPGTSVSCSPGLLKFHGVLSEPPSFQRPSITSNPAASEHQTEEALHRTKNLRTYRQIPKSRNTAQHQTHSGSTLHDKEIEKWIKDNLPSYDRPKARVLSITSLSSASSCDMFTDTDMSGDEHEIDVYAVQHALPRSTLKTIEVIVRKIEVNLRYAAYMQHNGGETSTTTSSNTSTSQQDYRKGSLSGGKRKMRSEDHQPPNDDDEDGGHKRRRGSLATVDSSETGARFACPFYKHEPNRYRNRRTCPGPGWPTVHRMKEHLYRAHAQSIYCPRCYTMFDADTDLSNHLRSQHCQVSAPQPIEGIDRETLKALRKRSPPLRLEEDKWRDVYSLLFPNVAPQDIPSPFYDSDSLSEDSRRFRRELLRRVQQELFTSARHLSGPVEQQLLQQVADIIRRCEEDLLNSFESSTAAVPSLYERRASDISSRSAVSSHAPSHNTTPAPAIANNPTLASPFSRPSTHPPNAEGSAVWHDPLNSTSRPPEQAVHFRPVPWDMPIAQTPSSEWINWDTIFPPDAGDTGCSETLSGFSVPMWSQ